MKINKSFTYLLMTYLLFFTCSCLNNEEYSPDEIQQLIQNEVDIRVNEYVAIRKAQCEEGLLNEATR